jgi:hypothetical protein
MGCTFSALWEPIFALTERSAKMTHYRGSLTSVSDPLIASKKKTRMITIANPEKQRFAG